MRIPGAWLGRLRPALRAIGLVFATSLAASCIVRDGEECDKNQVQAKTAATDYCECAEGFVADQAKGYGCVRAVADASDGPSDASTGAGDAGAGPDGTGSGACSQSSPCPERQRCQNGACAEVADLDESCTSSADCAAGGASACDTFRPAPICVVPECAANTTLCPTGYVCCAIAGMSFCGQGASCPPPTMMVP